MPGYYYGFDTTYLFIVLPCILLSLWASMNVKSTFNKYATKYSTRRITGAQAAQRGLRPGADGARAAGAQGRAITPSQVIAPKNTNLPCLSLFMQRAIRGL